MKVWFELSCKEYMEQYDTDWGFWRHPVIQGFSVMDWREECGLMILCFLASMLRGTMWLPFYQHKKQICFVFQTERNKVRTDKKKRSVNQKSHCVVIVYFDFTELAEITMQLSTRIPKERSLITLSASLKTPGLSWVSSIATNATSSSLNSVYHSAEICLWHMSLYIIWESVCVT